MRRGKFAILLAGISSALLLAACGTTGSSSQSGRNSADAALSVSSPSTDAMSPSDGSAQSGTGPPSEPTGEPAATRGAITVTIGAASFIGTLADTDAARAFSDRLPLTLDMTDVNDNEKAFDLADALPSDPGNPGIIHSGDLMLYGDHTIVVFYESFETSYTYTRIGHLTPGDGLPEALGAGDVTVTFADQ